MNISPAHYHRHTSYERDRMTPHGLDWPNQPRVFKDYPGIMPLPLPSDFSLPQERLSSVLTKALPQYRAQEINMEGLSLILRLAYSLTAKATHGGGDYYFRSVASAGALYPSELYVATRSVQGLDDGLYHFAIHRHSLTPIRTHEVSERAGGSSALCFFLTAIFFRSAWKYRDRSYRYHLLDTGHLAENLLLALKAAGLPFRLSYDFDDAALNRFLGLDESREVCLAVAQVAGEKGSMGMGVDEIPQLPDEIMGASRVSQNEREYAAITEFHRAGAKVISVKRPGKAMCEELGLTPMAWRTYDAPEPWPEQINYPEALFSRRSRRSFVREVLGKDYAGALINALCRGDFSDPGGRAGYLSSISTGLVAQRMQGMESGFYLIDFLEGATALVQPGEFMEAMARVCLDQQWLANAALHFLFMSNLRVVDQRWGPSGYRYAMLSAGRLGQRLYLAATAMGLGCCGVGAFYDREAANLLGLNAESCLLYLVAVGPVKSKRFA